VLIQFAALHFTGVYSLIWRFIGMAEIQAFIKAAVVSATALLLLRLGLPVSFQAWHVPSSIIAMDTVLAFGGVLALRVARRALYERYEILQGNVEVSRVRDVQVEDLLDRELIHLDELAVGRFLAASAVMVTGAGGSIGSELARQVARFQPSTLILVERAEFALFEIDRELTNLWPRLDIRAVVADVGDESRMRTVLSTHRPRVLLHAAAHKHLPMMEDHPDEAVKNNVLATRSVGELAGQLGVEAFVLISTDKAVRPTSVMGATKRLAELVVQELDRRYRTRYVAVRFGNVMGSAGSVIPIFREQIEKGGPVTVTHPEMTRYFMTISEASQLVLQAGTMGKGGEIFTLDMGRPVRILDLAKDMITLSRLKPFEDIDIVFTGVRPGEKLSEELEILGEKTAKTCHPKIFIGKLATYPDSELRRILQRLDELSKFGDCGGIRVYLNQVLPEGRLGIDHGLRSHQRQTVPASSVGSKRRKEFPIGVTKATNIHVS
jgi:FlaA1/EpsC-like NDP-sugar epimerase